MKLKNNNEKENNIEQEEQPQLLAESIQSQPQSEEVKAPDLPIRRGSTIKFIGTKSYSGLDISQYKDKKCKVKEISGDRVVIADGANIIAAVNIKDCVKI